MQLCDCFKFLDFCLGTLQCFDIYDLRGVSTLFAVVTVILPL